jgi:hypothetical protein
MCVESQRLEGAGIWTKIHRNAKGRLQAATQGSYTGAGAGIILSGSGGGGGGGSWELRTSNIWWVCCV